MFLRAEAAGAEDDIIISRRCNMMSARGLGFLEGTTLRISGTLFFSI
jgi:hypothetical protein